HSPENTGTHWVTINFIPPHSRLCRKIPAGLPFWRASGKRKPMRTLAKLLIPILISMTVSAANLPSPPIAPKKPKEIITHGDKRVDDYFWLREKTNTEVTAYLDAENKYAEEMMRGTKKLQEKLYKEILS